MSWRLPPRSSRWRWVRPELASRGATPLWARKLGVRAEAVDRADLGEQLGGDDAGAAGQLEQCWCKLGSTLFELVVELADHPVQRPAAADELARQPRLHLSWLTVEPATHPLELGGPAELPQRDLEGRVERVQVPAQPLLTASPLVDQIVAVIDQQLQITQNLLAGAWPRQVRLPQCCAGDR